MPLNPNAAGFSFNPNASGWSPTAAPPAPAAAAAGDGEEEIVLPPSAPPSEGAGASGGAAAAEEGGGEGDEEIDENDPLWLAFVKIAAGDKAKAKEMLLDPDQYMHLPEVAAALSGDAGAGGGGEEEADWEANQLDASDGAAAAADDSAAAGAGAGAASSAAADAGSGAAAEAVAGGGGGSGGGGGGAAAAAAAAAEEEEAVVEEEVVEADSREHLNLVFIGHVDAGKSTLSGNILYMTDHVDKRTIEKYEREAKQRNRESWFLAFIMDTNEEERAKGKTVEVGRAHFATSEKRYTIMDAPGHKSYVPNMIAGASQADIACLVVSARKNEFEAGFEKGGQTKEHAMLAKTLGVKFLVVVVNKMDDPTVNWGQARYDEITSKLKPFLKSCGFLVKKEVKFLPISALTGANLVAAVADSTCPWWGPMYKAGTHNTDQGALLPLLDSLTMTDRDPAAPFRMPVLDRYYDRGAVILGKVEAGTLRKGDKLMLVPTNKQSVVDGVYSDEVPVAEVRPGDNVMIRCALNVEEICKGFVVCNAKQAPARAVTKFVAFIYLADLTETRPIFTAGYDCIMHVHTVETAVVVDRILSETKKGVEQKGVRFAKQGAQITCVMSVPNSIVVAPFDVSPAFGRITLRDEGKSIAIGKILKLPPEASPGSSGGGKK